MIDKARHQKAPLIEAIHIDILNWRHESQTPWILDVYLEERGSMPNHATLQLPVTPSNESSVNLGVTKRHRVQGSDESRLPSIFALKKTRVLLEH